jgi:hypothetical protein
MENQDNEQENKDFKPGSTSQGRNSTDNFNDDQVDDYGIDYSKPGAEEELEYRQTVKGGRGPKGGARNPNDNFDEDPENTNEDAYKA